MSANSRVLESGVSGAMTLEGWCVLAMGALFGLFLLGVWWELRTNLRSIGRAAQLRERAAARLESRVAFERELERQAASKRVAALRAQAVQVQSAPVVAEHEAEVASNFGLESVGRILERLAQVAPPVESEIEVPAFAGTRPALNMVRGGKSVGDEDSAQTSAPRPRRSGQGGARGKARGGVKSSSISSSSIGSGAMIASR